MASRGPRAQLASRPSPQAVAAISSAAREIMDRVEDARHLEDFIGWHRERLALDYEWMQQSCRKGETVCELGACPFFLTRALSRAGFDVSAVGVPLPYDTAVAAAADVPLIACNIETQPLPFPDRSFDHVLLNEVFEHLRIDLISTMKEIRRVLRPQGTLWLSTPNLRSLRGIVNFIWKGEAWSAAGEGLYHQYRNAAGGNAGHVREYTAREVTAFLAAVGYSVEQVIYRGSYAAPGARIVAALAPSMKPYFSVLARPS